MIIGGHEHDADGGPEPGLSIERLRAWRLLLLGGPLREHERWRRRRSGRQRRRQRLDRRGRGRPRGGGAAGAVAAGGVVVAGGGTCARAAGPRRGSRAEAERAGARSPSPPLSHAEPPASSDGVAGGLQGASPPPTAPCGPGAPDAAQSTRARMSSARSRSASPLASRGQPLQRRARAREVADPVGGVDGHAPALAHELGRQRGRARRRRRRAPGRGGRGPDRAPSSWRPTRYGPSGSFGTRRAYSFIR